MTQTLPLSMTLGSANTGKLIGYSVLNLDRTEYASFALATESDVPGTYYAPGGYSAPDAGGYLVVSESDGGLPAVLTAMVETGIEPKAPTEAGTGTGTYTDTIAVGATPLNGVRVHLSTDAVGSNRVYETYTNALGVFTMHPDQGTYYRWLDLAGYDFAQGVAVVVT